MENKQHPWLKNLKKVDLPFSDEIEGIVMNDGVKLETDTQKKQKEFIDNKVNENFAELKKKQMVNKYGKQLEVSLYSLKKHGVFKVDNNGTWELVAKCETLKEAEAEIIFRSKEINIEIDKRTTLAKNVNPYKGTYVIFPVYEIK